MSVKYTVTLQEDYVNDFYLKSFECDYPIGAINKAKIWANEYPDKCVYIRFFRSNDGQVGFLNSDGGHSLSGSNWCRS